MSKSLDWLTGNAGVDGERRAKASPELPVLDPADFDPATGTLHWSRFMAILEAERSETPGALLMIDLNSGSGSTEALTGEFQGDVLPLLAQSIRQAVRAEDLIAHVAGYKFAVLLRGAEQEVAEGAARRIQESVDDTLFMTVAGILRLGADVGGALYVSPDRRHGEIVEAAKVNLDAARTSTTHVRIQ